MSNQSVPFQNLEGVIERLTYHNEDNGYTVAKFTPNLAERLQSKSRPELSDFAGQV